MSRVECEILKYAKKIDLPDSNNCEYKDVCDGKTCPKYNLEVFLDPLYEEFSAENTPKVPSGTERFYKKLEGWSQKREEKQPAP